MWSWAFIHGAFILVASAANIVSWRATEHLLRDPLTGLAGRAIMLDRLRLGLRRAQRKTLHAGVIFLDLDRFKVLNDSLGHAAGDRVLITASERLRDAVRANDTAAASAATSSSSSARICATPARQSSSPSA